MANIQTLIEQALLLRPDQRQKLLAAVPTMTPEQETELRGVLKQESVVVRKVTEEGIQAAVTARNEQFFAQLDVILQEGRKVLRNAEEMALNEDDEASAVNSLDAA